MSIMIGFSRSFVAVVLCVLVVSVATARGQALVQRGDYNSARAEVGAQAVVDQVQIGNRNEAVIGGDNIISPNPGSRYRQVQRGRRNTARIGETNVGTNVEQHQLGDGNHAAFETTDGTDSWFNAGTFSQMQRGDENVLTTHVGYRQWKRSDVDQVQRGNRNVARTVNVASGGEGVLTTRQSGDRNSLRFDWNHEPESSLELRQRGDRNRLSGAFTHAGQNLDVDQQGLDNVVNVRLEPTASSVRIAQDGVGNTVTVTR